MASFSSGSFSSGSFSTDAAPVVADGDAAYVFDLRRRQRQREEENQVMAIINAFLEMQ